MTPQIRNLSENQLTVLRVLAGEFVAREMELRYENAYTLAEIAAIAGITRQKARIYARALARKGLAKCAPMHGEYGLCGSAYEITSRGEAVVALAWRMRRNKRLGDN